MLGLTKESNNVEDSNDLNCSYCWKLRELNEYFNFLASISLVSTAISLACCNHCRTDYSEPGVSPLFNKPGVSPLFNKPGVSPCFKKSGVSPLFNKSGVSPLYIKSSMSPLFNKSGVSPLFLAWRVATVLFLASRHRLFLACRQWTCLGGRLDHNLWRIQP